jgi:glycosyltransferase involved in cell wall biosynthesis
MIELSIIIPTHGRPRELARTLESIRACQLRSYEIILISDMHDQTTAEVAERHLGKNDYYIVRAGKPGPAASRNLGISLAQGRNTLLFDDDDTLPGPDYQGYVDVALANPGKVIYGDVVLVKEDRERGILFPDPPERMHSIQYDFPSIYVKNHIYTQSCLYPTQVIKGIKQDTHMRSFEDWEYQLAVASQAEFHPVDYVAAIIHKDYVNTGNRRSTTAPAKNFELVLDYLYVYRRWPAATEELKLRRARMLADVGLAIAGEFL